ncbi:MAG: ATP-binding protein [Gammaproteobacteria bacterium]|nr:ATP-binding protein [Gammaproteobacteria bacterium]
MLKTLAMRGYRGFGSYRLNNLTRVNLVVGKNNSGKTSILEAVELLVSGGNPTVFHESVQRRGEMSTAYARRIRGLRTDISHIFFGHTFDPGANLELSADDGKLAVSFNVRALDEVGDEADAWDRIRKNWLQRGLFDTEEEAEPICGLSIDGGPRGTQVVLPVMEDGTLLLERHPRSIRNGIARTPVHFLTLEAFDPAAMGGMWNTVLTEGREAEIVEDMKLLEPDLDSIHYLTGAGFGAGILMGLIDGGRRLPIGVYGDGMRRLLALRLSFVGTANGFLLIDEIDTGLHWTIMEEMWQFIVEVARKSNVQVFATTHSYDCIRGLGLLLQSQPDLEDQVCIQKVDNSLKEAVCLKGEQIKIAVEQDLEVR